MKKEKIISILVIILLVLLFIIPFTIKIRSFECKNQYTDCSDNLNKSLEAVKGKNIFSAKSFSQKVLKSDNFISSFSIHFKLPNIIKIETVVKKPVYALNKKDTNDYIFVDGEGSVLTSGGESSLPTIIVNHDLESVGDKISPSDLFAVKLLEGIIIMYQINLGEIVGGSLVVELSGPVNVIFPLDTSDRDILLGSLRLIYSKIEQEGFGKYREIDLRFRNPVLR